MIWGCIFIICRGLRAYLNNLFDFLLLEPHAKEATLKMLPFQQPSIIDCVNHGLNDMNLD